LNIKVCLSLLLLLISKSSFDSLTKGHIDSIKPLIGHSLTGSPGKDTINIQRLNFLAADYFASNPDSTLYFGTMAVNMSRKINFLPGLANGLLQVAHANFFKGNYESAQQEFDEAELVFKHIKDKRGLAECYEWYGKMLSQQAKYRQALAYVNLSLGLHKQVGNKTGIAACYKNIGMVYFGEGQLTTALDFYYKALFIDVKLENKVELADIYNNIGDVLQNMEAYPRALEYYKKALTEAQSAKNVFEIGTASENIGEVLLAQKQYDEAIIYLNKSLKIAQKQDDKDGIAYVSADLGLCFAYKNQMLRASFLLTTALTTAHQSKIAYNEAFALISYATFFNLQKNYKNARQYALAGQQLSAKLGNVYFRASAAMDLYKCYAGMGQFKEAFKYSLQYNSLRDSLKINEGMQKLTSYNLSLNFAAKQQQLAIEQKAKEILYTQQIKQQKINATFGAVIILMIVVSVFYYRQKRRQQKTIAVLGEKNTEITHQKHSLNEQTLKLNESNILKDRLISVLAHDLRAPLSTLRGVFDLLQDSTVSIEEVLEMIPSVLKKLEHTSDFLDTLLFWINSQVENYGKSAKAFCLKDIVIKEEQNLAEQAVAKGIKLAYNVPETIVPFADPDSVRIVIRNLVINALKFSRKDDMIEISAILQDSLYCEEPYYLISVTDTGIGMSQERVKKLFNEKVNSSNGTGNESGTGMGLMFCKDLVEKSGGKIWVTSQECNGTQFFFTLPPAVKVGRPSQLEPTFS
jgi:two-component system sensor histidine kinase/response regulator